MSPKILFLSLLLALIALAQRSPAPSSLGAPRNDRWTIIGPGGGGAQFFPAISPHNPNDILVACDMTGAYVTHDGGRSWRMFNLGGVTKFFVFDPLDAKTYYAGVATGGRRVLWRSSDAGVTWRLVFPEPSAIQRVYQRDDHAANFYDLKTAPPSISALAIDPSNSQILYAIAQQGRQAGETRLLTSSDGGRKWEVGSALTGGGRSIFVDPDSPAGNRTLYVIGDNSVAVRRDGAWRTGPAFPGGARFLDAALGFRPGHAEPVVYGMTAGAMFVSEDAGATWHESQLPGASGELHAVATAGLHGNAAYVSYSHLAIDGERYFGVAKTLDAGRTWDLAWKDNTQHPAANVHDIWMAQRFGSGWASNPLSLTVRANDPNDCIGTNYGATLRSTDGGRNWNALYSKRLDDGSYTSTGLDVTTNYGVHFDPFDPQRLLISYTDIGLFRSENGGRGWVSATETGVPRRWVNTTYWMVFDPEVRGRAWAVMSGTHDLPRSKMWHRGDPDRYRGGVVASGDGGRTWQLSNQGMPETAATHILVDRSGAAGARVLYVTGFGRGVFKSVDDGKSWVLKSEGLPAHQPFAWRLAQDSRGALYLVIARRSDDGRFGDNEDGALYRSSDGAEHWTRVPLPKGLNGPNELAIDPRDPSRLYLASWGRDVTGGAVSGGVWLSTDSGSTWTNVLSRDQFVYSVTIDPRNPDAVYACGFSSSAWRSGDRGKTWRRIRGFNFKWGHRVVPDPLDASRVFITTFGGSVWYGPAEGDPEAAEDIDTQQLRYSR